MQQTPVHDKHNADLLALVPTSSADLIEVGCSSGALAREFKKLNPACRYFGIDIDSSYTSLAQRHCDETLTANIEDLDNAFFNAQQDRDCWIFGDTLEHLKDPWRVLKSVRRVMPDEACVVACIPNAQHWSVQVRLSVGNFRYEDSGLFDRTHLRWFTRTTINELFTDTGFRVVQGKPRVFAEPARDKFLPLIAEIARAAGANVDKATADSMALQYVVKAVPA
jgi:ubiquinone/menaquinone biosynthesis C-methylase UbiE